MSHDPVRLLGQVPPERLEQLGADPGFLRYLHEAESSLDRYLTAPAGSRPRAETVQPSPLRLVAYFSPSSGSRGPPAVLRGLGVLAGDHLKASSDLGVPLVGVGLFYRSGYFSQLLTVDGMQQERFSELDPDAGADPVRGHPHHRRPRRRAPAGPGLAGRCRPGAALSPGQRRRREHPDGRLVTDRLYGGDTEHRIRQEILLGIGGAGPAGVGLEPQVFHTNEGHAASSGWSGPPARQPGPDVQPRPSRRCAPAASSPRTRRCPPASTASPSSSCSGTSRASPRSATSASTS